MDRENLILDKFGVYPKEEYRDEIKELLIEEIENEEYTESHECLRVLCFLLFSIGNVEDCELIWKAKMLNMDAGCMVDVVFLCGAGYNETISYIGNKVGLEKMKCILRQYIGEEFDKEEVINEFKKYYNIQ
ncbi:hypothetical protein [Oceanirhabdus sp. W0125-5]|uniref:hypothetical protein n=1 Tax=Oceanirhabdus sp. W0125-5 TaxID=2999116 RepID=UPI0022F2AE50|nr:hypothetical protein [Oceanirhabdus sp. W0125-5]WBW99489.1 hypothetical protein OW730_12295 [Oceanirhabdus sp. W0125-5]